MKIQLYSCYLHLANIDMIQWRDLDRTVSADISYSDMMHLIFSIDQLHHKKPLVSDMKYVKNDLSWFFTIINRFSE